MVLSGIIMWIEFTGGCKTLKFTSKILNYKFLFLQKNLNINFFALFLTDLWATFMQVCFIGSMWGICEQILMMCDWHRAGETVYLDVWPATCPGLRQLIQLVN